MREVYLDNGSNTALDRSVLEEMLPYLMENYGNAQSMHTLGMKSRDAVEKARSLVARFINADQSEIIFASSGSEANNLAVKGIAETYKVKGKHIIVSAIEHFSVLNAAKRLEKSGFEVTYLPVDSNGVVGPGDLEKAIRADTILVSIQHANPEIGTIEPIVELAAIARQKGVFFHTDAVSTAGLVDVNVEDLGVDLLTLSGAQLYGPKGAAVLYLRKGVRVSPQIDGGIQEGGRRAGTEDVPSIVGFGKACEIAGLEAKSNREKLLSLRNKLIRELPKRVENIYLNGHPENRLPNHVNFSVEFVEGEGMLLMLDQKGIYVSSGSACASKALKMSHVLAATNMDPALAQGSIVMTFSKYNTFDDVEYVLGEFPGIVKRLRELSPLYDYFIKTGNRQQAGPGTDYCDTHGHEEQ